MRTTLENLLCYQKGRRPLDANKFLQKRMDLQVVLCITKSDQQPRVMLRGRVDYNEVFLPVVKHSSICILLALLAQYDYELDQLDVKADFLHDELEEEIYMTHPLGFRAGGKDKLVYKPQKSFYGLKQSPRQWYKCFDKFMIGYAYTKSLYDLCVYFHKLSSGEYIYLLLNVKDMLIASTIDNRLIN